MSNVVAVTHEGTVSTVTFNNPPFNLQEIDNMEALTEAHREADSHPDTRVIVTRSAIEGMFCNGLNPTYVLERDQAGRVEIFKAVGRMIHAIYGLTKPHIAVVNGPAMAGGAVLAILADFRYLDSGAGRICFAEPKVGVPIPVGLLSVIAKVCHPPMLREVTMLGKNLDAQQALDAGLSDGNAPSANQLEELVGTQVARLSRLSLDVLRTIKRDLRAEDLVKTEGMMEGDSKTHPFAQFVAKEYLEEGLTALLEGRHPVFIK